MNCKKCGAPLSKDDLICKNCGEVVDSIKTNNQDTENNQTVAVPVKEEKKEAREHKRSGSNVVTKIILIILILAIGGILLYFALPEIKTILGINEDNNNNTNIPVKTTNTIYYQGYSLELPNNYKFLIGTKYLTITNSGETWALTVKIIDKDYDQIMDMKDDITEMYSSSNITLSNMSEKTINNKDFITMELEKNATKFLLALTKYNDKIFVFSLNDRNNANGYNYNVLESMVPVILNTKQVDQTTVFYSNEDNTYIKEIENMAPLFEEIIEQ